MKLDRKFAEELCAQLGIEWDGQASAPTLRGAEQGREELAGLFTPATCFRYVKVCARGDGDSRPYRCSGEDLKCA